MKQLAMIGSTLLVLALSVRCGGCVRASNDCKLHDSM
jgi:hypothetical protein